MARGTQTRGAVVTARGAMCSVCEQQWPDKTVGDLCPSCQSGTTAMVTVAHDETRDALMERVNEAEAQSRKFGEMFTRQSGLIRDLYALLDAIEAMAMRAHWDGKPIDAMLLRALIREKPNESERLANPKYRAAGAANPMESNR